MVRSRSYRREALVLKSTPVGEADLIVVLYSRDIGKLRAIGHGLRKPTSKMVGHLEPLNRVELALATSRTGIDTITQAQVLEVFPSLKSNLEAVSKGVYLAELVDGFGAEGSPNPGLYSLFLDTLRFLEEYPDLELALRYFELHLLRLSGFMPEIYRCVECGESLSPGKHLFSPDVGGALCLRCTPAGVRIMSLSVQALKVLRFLAGTSLSELHKLSIHRELQEELKALLSATLRYWLDKEIRSKTFLDHLEGSRKIGVTGVHVTSP